MLAYRVILNLSRQHGLQDEWISRSALDYFLVIKSWSEQGFYERTFPDVLVSLFLSDQCLPRCLAVNKLSFVSNSIGFHSTFSICQIFDTVLLCLWFRRHCFLIILVPLSSLHEWTHFHCNLMQRRSKCGELSCFLSQIIEKIFKMTFCVKLRVYLFFSIWLYLAGPPSVCEKLISLHPSLLEKVHCKNHNWLKCGFNFLHNS